jgi:hypothetical protein
LVRPSIIRTVQYSPTKRQHRGRRRESPGDLRSRQASNGRHLDACVSMDAAQLAVTVPSIRLSQVQYILLASSSL